MSALVTLNRSRTFTGTFLLSQARVTFAAWLHSVIVGK